MCLHHVLYEATLLDEFGITVCARMIECPRMLLHVVEHRILPRLGFSASWAYKYPLVVLDVGHLLYVCHFSVFVLPGHTGRRVPVSTF